MLGAPVVKNATTAGALGVLGVKLEKSGTKYKRAHFLYGHTTDSMVSEHSVITCFYNLLTVVSGTCLHGFMAR